MVTMTMNHVSGRKGALIFTAVTFTVLCFLAIPAACKNLKGVEKSMMFCRCDVIVRGAARTSASYNGAICTVQVIYHSVTYNLYQLNGVL